MDDRELLELAAKAGGIDLHWNDAGESGYYENWRGMPQWMPWNPLADDGDALRLAVDVGMNLALVSGHFSVAAAHFNDKGVPTSEVVEPHNSDPYAATRRAIVRAAAAIAQADEQEAQR